MSMTVRQAYGEALVKYAASNPDIVVLDADVSSSTRSCVFGEAYPERFFNLGIAEANMSGVAAGLAATGKIPFVNTFATFISTLCLLGVRTFMSYSKANVKMVGAYSGLSDSYDGPTHHSLEDIAIMRSMPNVQVYVASDNVMAGWLVKNAQEVDAPMYIRLSREAFPELYPAGECFETGKGKLLREGKDITIIACGAMANQALAAADVLAEEGIQSNVVDMFCIKPIDRELILSCAAGTGVVLTAEEHNIIGGLGGAVAEVLAAGGATARQAFVGLDDTHAECGGYAELMEKYGIDAAAIVKRVKSLLHAR